MRAWVRPALFAVAGLLMAGAAVAQTSGNDTTTLSANARDQIAKHVRACWHTDPGMLALDKMHILLTVTTDSAGVARQAAVAPEDQRRMAGDSLLRVFAERAVRAVLDPQCAQLPLSDTLLGLTHQSDVVTFRFSPEGGPPSPAPPASSRERVASCKEDWKQCKDNSDLANNYEGMTNARVACRETANEQAKFGTPIWPGFWSGGAFGHFKDGNADILIGQALLIEPAAQFQNEFGAMAHKYVVCVYDLNSKTVVRVNILDR
jgi:hypothetical protein